MKMVLEADQHLGRNDLSDMIMEAELSEKQEKMLDVFHNHVREVITSQVLVSFQHHFHGGGT